MPANILFNVLLLLKTIIIGIVVFLPFIVQVYSLWKYFGCSDATDKP